MAASTAITKNVNAQFNMTQSFLAPEIEVSVELKSVEEVSATRGPLLPLSLCCYTSVARPGRSRRSCRGVASSASYYLHEHDRCELVLGYCSLNERQIAAGIRALATATRCL